MHVIILSGMIEGLCLSEKSAFLKVERKERMNCFALLSSTEFYRKNSTLAMSPAVHSHH